MGDWYWIGVCLGVGLGLGVLLAGVLGASRAGLAASLPVAALGGGAVGLIVDNWDEALAGAIGGLAGALATAQLARGALRSGGTRGGTAALLAGAGLVVAAVAFIPIAGYVEALVVPALGARLRRRSGERYAGLRTLARD